MYLTKFSDIGLRILMYLAKEQRESPRITINEISDQYRIPRNHVIKITSQLVRGGWVASTRGRSGGLELGRPATEIKIGEVIQFLEPRDELIDCAGIACRLSPDCELRSVLDMALNNFYEFLNAYSLAELIKGRAGNEIVVMQKQFLESIQK